MHYQTVGFAGRFCLSAGFAVSCFWRSILQHWMTCGISALWRDNRQSVLLSLTALG
jgi:hypothetical protein